MPRLRVLAGPSPNSLEILHANTGHQVDVKSDVFEGRIAVFLKNFENENGEKVPTDYFDHPERGHRTWSIQFRGRFLEPVSANDVLFGNVFDRKLPLPFGFGAALKFVQYVDPGLEHDLHSDSPWALSPLVMTMTYMSHSKWSDAGNRLSVTSPVEEDTTSWVPEGQRRKLYFMNPEHRKAITLGPDSLIEGDFAHGHLSFENGLALSFPGGIHFDLMKFWDGRPVQYVCIERGQEGKTSGRIYWCVVIEIAEDEGGKQETNETKGEEVPNTDDAQDISGDVD